MSGDDVEAPLWRRLVINRFVLVPATIAIAVAALECLCVDA